VQGAHPALELGNQVLLVAALAGLGDDLVGGDVEEVAVLVEQHVVAPRHRDVLAQATTR
jgi:hypothetical protein